ncbi:MAG: acyl-CoA ligase (AMP-forming), exosortase A system-associated [Steroidobacteraceae bacterium]
MTTLLYELPLQAALSHPERPALRHKDRTVDYATLATAIEQFASAVVALGIGPQERIAVFLPKQTETVVAMFGTARAGCAFVPVNSVLKPPQVAHILRDCNVRMLVTSPERARDLATILPDCPDLRVIVAVGGAGEAFDTAHTQLLYWQDMPTAPRRPHRVIDTDVVSIFYTSGSTGKPKGVVLSHRNMVAGAISVASYLENSREDRLLAVLPFSFDYGFSQLSTAFLSAASVVLIDYLFARDVITLAAREKVTGLAGVPPLWIQLADLPWPEELTHSLRYITNSGGAMPVATLNKLRAALPRTKPYLMYGLTEAFRSTYLPPDEIDRRPESMGKAIPNAEILVVGSDGRLCGPNEPGELVHRGALVSLGYWNDPAKTAERFKPAPARDSGLVLTEMAVWSGDSVRMDEDGFLYFIGRRDEMIKTSGYRVSPTEVEEAVYASQLVGDAVAVGVPHPTLGQAIVLIASPADGQERDSKRLLDECRKRLALYMVPQHVDWRDELPRNPNGKFDRPLLATQLRDQFGAGSEQH